MLRDPCSFTLQLTASRKKGLRAAAATPPRRDDVACLLYSDGGGGIRRAVEVTHGSLIKAVLMTELALPARQAWRGNEEGIGIR